MTPRSRNSRYRQKAGDLRNFEATSGRVLTKNLNWRQTSYAIGYPKPDSLNPLRPRMSAAATLRRQAE